ncbi:alkaline shock response membrane anchor protein AmaP [Kitasatospora sp. NBC_01266]|uniref:alkaline shock response membrane anchor protein AmaP n=1 Tax=Kitasatospora sp. NBC_01266 TaxID=2903572 RepID=UPI002E37FD33|nr:alkaline shock response membrane anchor protein AmaP [Kitasatospora sp. NBC_01266]
MSRATVNRLLLGVIGVLLVLGALLVLAGGLSLYRHLGVTPPSWWPLTRPGRPVLSTAERTRWRDRGWWWPAVVAGLVALALLALWWLLAQLRRPTPAELELPTAGVPGLRLRLRAEALAEAVQGASLELAQVTAARVAPVGRGRRLRLRVILLLEPGAGVPAVVDAFRAGPAAHAAAALGRTGELPLDLRIQVAPTPAPPHPRKRRRGRREARVS